MLHNPLNCMASYPVTFCAFSLCVSLLQCMHDRLKSAILLNNVIKTILPRSIGLFGFFFYEFRALLRCPFFFQLNFVVLQIWKNIFCKCVSLKTNLSPPDSFILPYSIEAKRKSAKIDCVINSYIQNNKKNKKNCHQVKQPYA